MTALYLGGSGEDKAALARRFHGEHAHLIENLHLRVRECLDRGEAPSDLLPGLLGSVVTCDEVGYGVIPLDKADRLWRDEVGRLCSALAQQADLVVFVTCGLPQVLKGTLPDGNHGKEGGIVWITRPC